LDYQAPAIPTQRKGLSAFIVGGLTQTYAGHGYRFVFVVFRVMDRSHAMRRSLPVPKAVGLRL